MEDPLYFCIIGNRHQLCASKTSDPIATPCIHIIEHGDGVINGCFKVIIRIRNLLGSIWLVTSVRVMTVNRYTKVLFTSIALLREKVSKIVVEMFFPSRQHKCY